MNTERGPLTLTPRQFEALAFIVAYRKEHGYSPTFKEAAAFLGITPQTAREHVLALKEVGALESNRWGSRRDLYLTDRGRELMKAREEARSAG